MAQDDSKHQVDAICDNFETSWKNGNRPAISEYVARAAPESQELLLKELVRLDLEYQLKANSEFSISRYLNAFGMARSDVSDMDTTLDDRHCQDTQTFSVRAGTEIGRFRIERVLGCGGFGVVYLAHDPLLKRNVALKIPRDLLTKVARVRFLREAEAIASLDHPSIVSVFEAGETEDFCFIATAFCDGPTLSKWMKEQDCIPVSTAVRIMKCLADAMQHAHGRGVIHRDLKPSNVMLVANEQTDGVFPFDLFVTDFGLAKLLEQKLEDTNSSVVLGTPAYMAPEQIGGPENPSAPHLADIYALGVILYELLTGQRPFEATSVVGVMDAVRTTPAPDPTQIRSELSRDIVTICMTCLEKRAEDRYANCTELWDDLTRVENGDPISARRPNIRERSRRVLAKPARSREAGILTFLLGAIVPVWVTMAITLIAYLDLIPEIRGILIPQAAMLSFILMAPLAWTGYRTWQGSVKWARIGLVFAIFNLIVCVLPLMGPTLVFPELYAQYPVARIIIYSLLTILYLIQVIQYAVILKFQSPQTAAEST